MIFAGRDLATINRRKSKAALVLFVFLMIASFQNCSSEFKANSSLSSSSSISGSTSQNNPTGTATVTWQDPTQNTDGSLIPITELAGYNIYYGTSQTALTNKINVPGATQITYKLTGLTSGTWYFAVTAYSTSGTESSKSTTILSKTIP